MLTTRAAFDAQREATAIADVRSLAAEAATLQDADRRIGALRAKRDPGGEVVPVDSPSRGPSLDAAQRESLDAEIVSQEKARDAAHDALSKKSPALLDLVATPIPNLEAVRARLAPDEALVRYLPTDGGLLVDVIDHDGTTSRTVSVLRSELEARARRAAFRLLPGRDDGLRADARAGLAGREQPPLEAELAWLYAQLLRPVEPELATKRQVFVLAPAPLAYLPFEALVRFSCPEA